MNKLLMPGDEAILKLTRKGEIQLKEPGTVLTPAQLQVLVLVDGQGTVGQLLQRAGSLPPEDVRTGLVELIAKGFVSASSGQDYGTIDAGDFFTSFGKTDDADDIDEAGLSEAEANVAFLQRNGYYVSLALGPGKLRPREQSGNLKVLVIDDDEDIRKLLQMFLKMEGFDTHTASNRQEILAELNSQPLPDLVLLDVWLPDANGFDLLTKIRQHPALKGIAVIMLTSDATRGAVIKGLRGGANGFVTKPFEIHPLVTAIKTVLGLPQ